MVSFAAIMILLVPAFILCITYAALLLFYRQAWIRIAEFDPEKKEATTGISVIIPARNEEENIERLLYALMNQTYPPHLYEIIVVDDDSTDKTAELVSQFHAVKLLRLKINTHAHKKKAIEAGIEASKHNLIVTTDADCVPGQNWLWAVAAFKEQTNAVMIAGPVAYSDNGSLFQIFQSLDFMTLQGITGVSLYKEIHGMGNGANLAYEKKVFGEVNGFAGIDEIASGDDMLLIQKMIDHYPDRVLYLKSTEAIVTTQPSKTRNEFLNQRIRWASKALYYNNSKIILTLVLVYLFNLLFPVLLFAGLWDQRYWLVMIALLIIKSFTEYLFIKPVSRFFRKERLLNYFILLQPLHILYTLIAGFLGQWGKYEWKGRRVR